MTVLAKSVEGQEFLYSASSAHKVAKAAVGKVCEALNKLKYNLKEGEVWYKHDVDEYDSAFDYAQTQRFVFCSNGSIREVRR